MAASDPPSPPPTTRRTWLDAVIRLFGFITGVAVITPAASYLWPITRRGAGSAKQEIAGAADLKVWESKAEVVAGKPVILVRKPDGFAAYSAVCTHLGCIVKWDEKKRTFDCPCHAATFDENGKVVNGPPPKELTPYRVTQAGNALYIES